LSVWLSIFYINKDDIIVTVNGEPIFQSEIENALSRYENMALTREDLIMIAIEEVLVVQEAEKLGIIVDDNELDKKVKALEHNYPKFYSLAVE